MKTPLEEVINALRPFAQAAMAAKSYGHEAGSTCEWRLKADDLYAAKRIVQDYDQTDGAHSVAKALKTMFECRCDFLYCPHTPYDYDQVTAVLSNFKYKGFDGEKVTAMLARLNINCIVAPSAYSFGLEDGCVVVYVNLSAARQGKEDEIETFLRTEVRPNSIRKVGESLRLWWV